MRLTPDPLPLFPLRTVLFPGGHLPLRVFEARYLDLVGRSLRQRTPFGVVCLRQGTEVRQRGGPTELEPVGVLAHLAEVDAVSPGILKVLCVGGSRFKWGSVAEAGDGLWQAHAVRILPDDEPTAIGDRHAAAAAALGRAFDVLAQREGVSLPPVRRLEDAGWVANRWAELLPLPLAARQQWMALADPLQRLALVDDFLRQNRLV